MLRVFMLSGYYGEGPVQKILKQFTDFVLQDTLMSPSLSSAERGKINSFPATCLPNSCSMYMIAILLERFYHSGRGTLPMQWH